MCNFSKHKGWAAGAVGVLTYDVFKKGDTDFKKKIAIMFSVPHNYSLYKNWAGVGIFDQDKPTDEELFKEMYKNEEMVNFIRKEADGSNITFRGKLLDILCTMSPLGRAIMKVEIWEKVFDVN